MRRLSLLLVLALALPTVSHAAETRLVVHVLAHDAKLIGDAAGGAKIVVRDAETGTILAQGFHLGGTGSTDRIIKDPQVRGSVIYDTEGAAHFLCELDLERPTWVRIEAAAPLAYPQSLSRASTTLLMVPGRHVEGDGIVLELNGLIVHLLSPNAESRLHGGASLEIRAGVKLLCTCPIFEGSLWDASDYRVDAELWSKGELLTTTALDISETANVFVGEMQLPEVAEDQHLVAELRIVAGNDARHNFGIDRAVFKIVH